MAIGDKLRALQIKANIIADKQIGLMEVNAEVQDGIAILTGEVENEEQKQIAEQMAYEVDGIDEVHNELQVVPESLEKLRLCNIKDAHLGYGLAEGSAEDTTYAISGDYEPPGPGIPASEQFAGEFTDEEIDEELNGLLSSETEVNVSSVQASSINQIVYLKGALNTQADLNRLQDMVMKARGVMGICSDIAIRKGELGTPVE